MTYLQRSLHFSLSSSTQFYTSFLQLKSTNENAQNSTYKIKGYFPQSVQSARHTPFILLLRQLHCCILQRLEL